MAEKKKENETEVNKPGTPITKEDKKAFKEPTKSEQEAAVLKATQAERDALEAREKELTEAMKTVNPGELSDHQRAALGIEERPVKKEKED